MNFDQAFERLIGHEGGYVNHPEDPGGETHWGITLRTAREHGYTGEMRDLTREKAKDIYRRAYWLRVKADQYDSAIAFQVFDAAVNHGVKQAVRWLQRSLKVTDDGVIGSATVAAAKAANPSDVLARFNAQRLDFYTRLPAWPTFGKGWVRRVAANLQYAAGDVA